MLTSLFFVFLQHAAEITKSITAKAAAYEKEYNDVSHSALHFI